MILATASLLQSTGAIFGLIGFFWRLWDNRASEAGILAVVGLLMMIVGEVVEHLFA
jgi:xanthosine utilization system XapX-like protein